jgi:hypothetical protein
MARAFQIWLAAAEHSRQLLIIEVRTEQLFCMLCTGLQCVAALRLFFGARFALHSYFGMVAADNHYSFLSMQQN